MDTTIILLIVNVFAAVAVIALTLIQQPKGDMGSAFGGGGSQSMFGSRGSANFLTKATSWMCFVFFATSLMLAYLYAQVGNDDGVIDQSVIEEVLDAELPAIVETAESIDAEPAQGEDLPQVPTGVIDESVQTLESAVEGVSDSAIDAADAAQVVSETVKETIEKASE